MAEATVRKLLAARAIENRHLRIRLMPLAGAPVALVEKTKDRASEITKRNPLVLCKASQSGKFVGFLDQMIADAGLVSIPVGSGPRQTRRQVITRPASGFMR